MAMPDSSTKKFIGLRLKLAGWKWDIMYNEWKQELENFVSLWNETSLNISVSLLVQTQIDKAKLSTLFWWQLTEKQITIKSYKGGQNSIRFFQNRLEKWKVNNLFSFVSN